ncbi:hypothetical protein M8194_001991 [Escherichia coli]|nr:hypothetical protein [Escherichia coli]
MKEFKGTPGEWNYSHARGEVVSKSEGLIAELVVNGREDNNGILIAAAPDLLEALQSIIELQTRGYVVLGDKYTNMARAAISKALGED